MRVNDRIRRVGMYTGGFIGPFGGGMVIVLVPEFREAFDVSTGLAAASITVYMVPYAVLQLVSGTLGERYGKDRVLRRAFLAYALASIAAALATSIVPFLIARAIQGCTNAFTSPLALTRLADATPEESMGRAMGTWATVQTAAVVMSPLLGGLAGAYDYRLAFVLAALVALVLAVIVPAPGGERIVNPDPPTLRSALTPRVAWVGLAATLFFLCSIGLGVIVSLEAADEYGVGADGRGLLLALFGVAGIAAGRPAGILIDRLGLRKMIIAALSLTATGLFLMAFAGSIVVLGAFWMLAGFAAAAGFTVLNTLSMGASTANRGGAISIIGSFRFVGAALGPLVWVTAYHAGGGDLAFSLAAAGCLASGVAMLCATKARATHLVPASAAG